MAHGIHPCPKYKNGIRFLAGKQSWKSVDQKKNSKKNQKQKTFVSKKFKKVRKIHNKFYLIKKNQKIQNSKIKKFKNQKIQKSKKKQTKISKIQNKIFLRQKKKDQKIQKKKKNQKIQKKKKIQKSKKNNSKIKSFWRKYIFKHSKKSANGRRGMASIMEVSHGYRKCLVA